MGRGMRKFCGQLELDSLAGSWIARFTCRLCIDWHSVDTVVIRVCTPQANNTYLQVSVYSTITKNQSPIRSCMMDIKSYGAVMRMQDNTLTLRYRLESIVCLLCFPAPADQNVCYPCVCPCVCLRLRFACLFAIYC